MCLEIWDENQHFCPEGWSKNAYTAECLDVTNGHV
jgi:hypothetical protein